MDPATEELSVPPPPPPVTMQATIDMRTNTKITMRKRCLAAFIPGSYPSIPTNNLTIPDPFFSDHFK
jgi:hypothetical protein